MAVARSQAAFTLVCMLPAVIGNIVYSTGLGVSGNLPFAAAFAAIPVVIMAVYLTLAKRTGAFDSL